MQHYSYIPSQEKYPIVFLVPSIKPDEIRKEYLDPLHLDAGSVMCISPYYDRTKKKTSAADMKKFIVDELVETLDDLGAEYVVVADADYFKILTKSPNAAANLGYVMDSPFGKWKVVYIPNYRTVFYDPGKIRAKINQAMEAVKSHAESVYEDPGTSIIKYASYPDNDDDIQAWLDKLLEWNVPLSCDIEAFSLKHYEAGIGTITFAWSQTEGIAFPVDYVPIEGATEAPYGMNVRNERRREMLRNFYEKYNAKITYHSIGFDVTVLIAQLYMKSLIDTEGLLRGLEVMLKNWDDTKLITYLATNSCAGNKLSLKEQAQEYAGNYAEDEIDDITKIPLPRLLQYNLVDGLSTNFVKEKWWDKMVADEQLEIYDTLFKPSIVDIIQMQLTGMPLKMGRVIEVTRILEADEKAARDTIHNSNIVKAYTYKLNEKFVAKKNAEYKKKRITLADANEIFNPNSDVQVSDLLFNELGLPVLSLTKNKKPATDADTLKALKAHTKDPEILEFLSALLDHTAVTKILTSFIPAMLSAPLGPDGWHYLFGNFNLGGTVSGRLSSNRPNLQTIPANSKYAKLIKSCFQAPPGWLFCGLDFASLEDKISGLTTKDPNKLKVYTGLIVYELIINGVARHIRDDDTIVYDGKSYTGAQFYATYRTL